MDLCTLDLKDGSMSYTVGEAARRIGVAPSTLRYYESEGLLPEVARTKSGRRCYSERDLEACRVIECLKESGLSIKEIRDFMNMVQQGDATLSDRLALFKDRRKTILAEIEQLQKTLSVVDFKCWYYQTALDAGTEEVVKDLPLSKIPTQHQAARKHLIGE